MSQRSFWERLKSARIVRVLIVYLAASWIVLQLAATLNDLFTLPPWLGAVTLALLAVGLVIILATAWVQSHPLTDQREAADEVPESWEVDVRGLGTALSKGRLPHLTWARAILGGVFAFSLLFGFAGLYVVIQDRGRSFAPDGSIADEADPGIAFMPFTVSGAGLDHLREGMVTLLYASLDGAAGVRAISDRTVLAQWDRLVGTGERADLRTAVRVAAETGARYALLGSVVAVGPNLRLSGDIHSIPDGASLGRVQVEGAGDSLTALVEELAVGTLRAFSRAGLEILPAADLSDVTTHSLPALTAYLDGEALFRRGDFVAALPRYERALAEDSSFALAHYRAGLAVSWDATDLSPDARNDRVRRHMEDALRLGLPSRTALYARSQGGAPYAPEVVEELRDIVRRHPDDAEAWYQLGEELWHGDRGLLQFVDAYEQAGRAFSRAAELDPGFAPYMLHPIDLAFFEHNPVDAARWVRAYNRASPDSPRDRAHRILHRLVFEAGQDSLGFDAAIDTLVGLDLQLDGLLRQPRMSRIGEALSLRRSEQSEELDWRLCAHHALAEGRWAAFFTYTRHERMPPIMRRGCLYWAYLRDFPVSDELLVEADAAAAQAGGSRLWEAIRAASLKQWDGLAVTIADFEEELEAARAEGDTTEVSRWRETLGLAEGYAAWQRGELERALARIEDHRGVMNLLFLGRISLDLERPDDALRYFRTLRGNWAFPWTRILYYEGLAYEQLGELEKARETYAEYLDIWKNADPELEPMKEEARLRLEAILAVTG